MGMRKEFKLKSENAVFVEFLLKQLYLHTVELSKEKAPINILKTMFDKIMLNKQRQVNAT